MYETIRYEQVGTAGLIELHRPKAMNAFTAKMMYELLDVLDRCDADDSVRAIVLTGSGDRAFCAGADLSNRGDTFAEGGSDIETDAGVPRDGGGMVSLRLFRCLKPVIVAFNGAAVGVGVTMTLPADVRIAADNARFGFVFNRRGILPEATSSWFLPRLVGISQALQWCYSGRVFDAEEALRGGLVSEVVPADELRSRALALVDELTAESAPVSLALTRQLLWRMLGASHPMFAHRADSRGILFRGRSADAVEGVESFLDKRAAVFTDRVSQDLPDLFPDWDEPEFA